MVKEKQMDDLENVANRCVLIRDQIFLFLGDKIEIFLRSDKMDELRTDMTSCWCLLLAVCRSATARVPAGGSHV